MKRFGPRSVSACWPGPNLSVAWPVAKNLNIEGLNLHCLHPEVNAKGENT